MAGRWPNIPAVPRDALARRRWPPSPPPRSPAVAAATAPWPGAPIILDLDRHAARRPAAGLGLRRRRDAGHRRAWRADGMLFENAYAHVPLTLPSHASLLLTGSCRRRHGVRSNVGYRLRRRGAPDAPGLLARPGVRDRRRGLGLRAAPRDRAGARFRRLRRRGGGRGVGHSGRARSVRATQRSARRSPGSTSQPKDEAVPSSSSTSSSRTRPTRQPEPFRSRYRDPYDGEVAAADAIVGRFLDELAPARPLRRGADRPPLRPRRGPGRPRRGGARRAPLSRGAARAADRQAARRPPGGQRVAAPVALVDVFPTVCAALSVECPAGLPGRSLLGGAASDEAPRAPDLQRVALCAAPSRLERAALAGRRAVPLHRGPRSGALRLRRRSRREAQPPRHGAPRAARARDPAGGDPARSGGSGSRRRRGGGAAGRARLPGQRRRRARRPAARPEAARPQPRAGEARPRADPDRAAPRGGGAVPRDPARISRARGRPHPARRDAAPPGPPRRVAGGVPRGGAPLADAARHAGGRDRQAGARPGPPGAGGAARRARRSPPIHSRRISCSPAWSWRAAIWPRPSARRGRRWGRRRTRARRRSSSWRASWSSRAGCRRPSRSWIGRRRASAAAGGRCPRSEATRGDVLARLGRPAEAEAAFRREIELFPRTTEAYVRLAILLAAERRFAEISPTLEAMVRAVPAPRDVPARRAHARRPGQRARRPPASAAARKSPALRSRRCPSPLS